MPVAANLWPKGEGEAARCIREFYWNGTSPGTAESWAHLRPLVDLILGSSFPMAILWEADLLFIYNDAYRVIVGEKHPKAMGRPIREVWPEIWEFNKSIFERVMARGESVHLEDQFFPIFRHGHRDETYFTISYSPIHNEHGQVVGILVVLKETTKRKLIEEALRESEAKFRSVLDSSIDVIYRINVHTGRYIYLSPSTEKVMGYSSTEIMSWDRDATFDKIHPDDLPSLRSALADAGTKDLEYRWRDKTGSYRWISNNLSIIKEDSGGPLYRNGNIRDITERKLVEERTAWLASFPQLNPNPIAEMFLPDGKVLYTNASAARLFPDLEALGPAHPFLADIPDTASTAGEATLPIRREVAIGGSWYAQTLTFFPDQRRLRLYGLDITERKRAEKALRASERLLKTAIDLLPVGMWVLDAKGQLVISSAAAQRIWAGVRYVGVDQLGEYKGWRTADGTPVEAHEWAGARALLKGEITLDQEVEIECFDGTRKIILDSAVPIRESNGTVIGAITVNQDITERKLAEEALRRAHERLTLAQVSAGAGIWDWDMTTERLEWSSEMFRLMGLDPARDEASFETWRRILHPEDREAAGEGIRVAVESRSRLQNEYRIVLASGEIRWISALGDTVCASDGKPLRMSGICINITERKRDEEALRQAHLRLQTFFDHRIDGIGVVIATAQGKIVQANDYYLKILGCTREELTAGQVDWRYATPPEWLPTDEKALAQLQDRGVCETYEKEYLRRDGTRVPVSIANAMMPGEGGDILSIVLNVTAQRKTEEDLRRSREDLARAQTVGQIGSWRLDTRLNILAWSDENHRIFGVPKGTPLTYEAFLGSVHPDDRQYVDVQWAAGLRGEPYDIEHRLLVNGQVKWVREKAYLEFDQAGALLGGFGITQDITDRKRAEEALRESEALFHQMANSIPQLAWIAKGDGYIYWYNQRWYEYTGTRPEQMEGWGWQSVHDPAELPKVLKRWKASIATGKPFEMTFPLRGADGIFRPFLTRGFPHKNAKGQVIQWFGTNTDVSASRRMEELLRDNMQELEDMVEKKTSELDFKHRQLKELAEELFRSEEKERKRLAEVLHDDLQQILVACMIHLSRLHHHGKVKDEINELLLKAIETSRSLSSELRPPVLFKDGLAAGMKWFAAQIINKHRLKIDIQSDGYEEIEDININGMLYQCLRELILNIVKYAGVKKATLSFANVRGGSQIILEDHGAGFDVSEYSKRQKDNAAGTGLFALEERLIAIGGKYFIESGPKRGTRVTLIIPRQETKSPLFSKGGAAGSWLRKNEKILVLVSDDHQLIREGLVKALADDQNISVIGQAADGLETVSKTDTLKPDVVLMDINMPALDGLEATRRLRKKKSKTKIIIMSVDTDKVTENKAFEAGADAFIPKTANIDSLKQIIRNFGA